MPLSTLNLSSLTLFKSRRACQGVQGPQGLLVGWKELPDDCHPPPEVALVLLEAE